jgi:hypothetical protein
LSVSLFLNCFNKNKVQIEMKIVSGSRQTLSAMTSEDGQAQIDPSPSEPTGYPYQPQPPTYYPVGHEQESSSSSAGLSRGIENQSILRCRGPREGDSRNNLYRWAKWYVVVVLERLISIAFHAA